MAEQTTVADEPLTDRLDALMMRLDQDGRPYDAGLVGEAIEALARRPSEVIGPEEVDTEYEASPPPPEAHAAYPDLDALLSAEEARRATAASEHIENITDAEDGVVDGEEG